jgi:DNA-binding MarR family transcriptional regulator
MQKVKQGGFLIAKIHTLSERILAKLLKKYKLEKINPAQGRIFFALWQRDGVPIAELARITSLEKSTLTSMLDRMEKNGFITRVPSNVDRRVTTIKLTGQTRKLRDIYENITKEKTDLFYKGFSAREIGLFEGYLQRILDNLEGFRKKGCCPR